jgi:hypothetical protein
MKKQTAVEWMAIRYHHRQGHLSLEDIEKAKQMMKEQISIAWDDGNYAYFYSKETGRDFDNGKQYYNETYNNENNTQNQ